MPENLVIDTDLGEALYENEVQITREIVAIISDGIRAQHQPAQRPALRDAHPKAHGCVKATFTVEPNLPLELAQGVFVPGTTYPAIIRFSNGTPDLMLPDWKPDARGMAIKLLDVPGEKLLPDERGARTQDFIMINHPVFFLDDPARYLKLQELQRKAADPSTFEKVIKALGENHPGIEKFVKKLVLTKAVGSESARLIIEVTDKIIGSPLTTQYWSMSVYRLGDPPRKQAIRFTAVPKQTDIPIPAKPTRNYLRETMIAQLETKKWQFDFQVQVKPPAMSVDMVEWPKQAAPFKTVATIAIPSQQFATPARDQFCENLSFTPWHALPQHRPLGAVNRMRRAAYEAISTLRHKLNGTERREPAEQDVP